ncbi:MAG: hypothetical protein F4X92_05625 [Gammaproteobacteria bacterium]|nr:hypothetical protein [Gammaproteobacteria bacterium]
MKNENKPKVLLFTGKQQFEAFCLHCEQQFHAWNRACNSYGPHWVPVWARRLWFLRVVAPKRFPTAEYRESSWGKREFPRYVQLPYDPFIWYQPSRECQRNAVYRVDTQFRKGARRKVLVRA